MQGQKMWFQHIIANYPQAKLGVDPRLLTAGSTFVTQAMEPKEQKFQ